MSNIHYRLGFYKHIDESKAQPEVNIRTFQVKEYEHMRERTKIIWESHELYFSWSMLVNNYENYLNTTKERKEKLPMHSRIYIASESSISDMVKVSQEVTNFLATTSTFLIVSQRFIKAFFGKKSAEYSEWNKYRQKLHKDSLPYQVMYELRNFSQHYTIPISGAKFTNRNGNLSVDSYIEIKKLLECGYDWKKFSNTLKKLDDMVLLSDLIEGYYDCLKKIIMKTSQAILCDLNTSHNYLQYIYKEYGFPRDIVPIVFTMDGITDDFNQLNHEYIPTYHMDYIESLIKNLDIEMHKNLTNNFT